MIATKKNRNSPSAPDSEGEVVPPFEESIQRLGKIVEELERGDLELEHSLTLFEEGVRLARASQLRLENAERRVEELLAIDARGNPVVRELEDDPEE